MCSKASILYIKILKIPSKILPQTSFNIFIILKNHKTSIRQPLFQTIATEGSSERSCAIFISPFMTCLVSYYMLFAKHCKKILNRTTCVWNHFDTRLRILFQSSAFEIRECLSYFQVVKYSRGAKSIGCVKCCSWWALWHALRVSQT